ncbi:MAG: hypothetical protein CMI60_16225 [Parvibaculum sp.]|nr:hypothetical protein [Parvibaculum sp.]|tara:strand:+ start:1040 stop:1786 length:747 start_codon:yes stop_codon:yes gene_type:complete
MVSVETVYETLKDLLNKDQKGMITPSMFNNYAQVAQMRVYSRIFDSVEVGTLKKKGGVDAGGGYSRTKVIREDLSHYSKATTLSDNDAVFSKPSDMFRLISGETAGALLMGFSTSRPVELCYDEEKIGRILNSTLSAPSEEYPVALVAGDIEIFPKNIKKLRIRYYRRAGSIDTGGTFQTTLPQYSYTTVSNIEVFDATTARNFDLPDRYLNDVVMEMAELAGVSMRDQFVTSYANAEQASLKQEQIR